MSLRLDLWPSKETKALIGVCEPMQYVLQHKYFESDYELIIVFVLNNPTRLL